ncbi:MAG TPA: hypothetical protein VLV76_03475 [Candidatus Acidoferrum sp.]|nr:hypothetical protein [Candidatus Acidoferrum sp.]
MQQLVNDPWQLVQEHRYADALAAYDAALAAGDQQRAPWIANRGIVLLCLGRWQEAFDAFAHANEIKNRKTPSAQPYLTKMATAQWLMGGRGEAIGTLRRAVDGVASGQIGYADSAGGVSQGLLLWYAGATVPDEAARDHALAYLSRLSDGRRIQFWPGPLALYVLGRMPFEETLRLMASSSADLAKAEVSKRRRLCQALFYAAVAKRHEGEESACMNGMRQCYALENPLLEEEWYLARAEVGA